MIGERSFITVEGFEKLPVGAERCLGLQDGTSCNIHIVGLRFFRRRTRWLCFRCADGWPIFNMVRVVVGLQPTGHYCTLHALKSRVALANVIPRTLCGLKLTEGHRIAGPTSAYAHCPGCLHVYAQLKKNGHV